MTRQPAVITVITPCLNGSSFVHAFFQSLLKQTYARWNCIFVDSGSTDDSIQIASSYAQSDHRIELLRPRLSSPLSPASARNLALKSVTTELVAFCDIDDLWHPSKLDQQISFHQKYHLDISCTSYYIFHELSTPAIPAPSPPFLPLSSHFSYFLANPVPMLTVIARTELLSSGFPNIRHEDYALWLTLYSKYPSLRIARLPRRLAFYRIHSDNITRHKLLMPFWTFNVFYHHSNSWLCPLPLILLWLCYQLPYAIYKIIYAFIQSRLNPMTVSELSALPPMHSEQDAPF